MKRLSVSTFLKTSIVFIIAASLFDCSGRSGSLPPAPGNLVIDAATWHSQVQTPPPNRSGLRPATGSTGGCGGICMSGSITSASVTAQSNGLYTYTLTVGGLSGTSASVSVFWGVGASTSGSTGYTVTNGSTITITNMPASANGYVEFIGNDSSGTPISGDLNDYGGGTGIASPDSTSGCGGNYSEGGKYGEDEACPLTRVGIP